MAFTKKEPLETERYVPSNLVLDLLVTNAPPNRTLPSYLFSLWLFTKNDFKTAVLPQAVFAVGIALSGGKTTPLDIVTRLPITLAWSWLHLLAFTIANQRQPASILEDAINKPWRPLPSGCLTPTEALQLLRLAIPAAVLSSVWLGNYPASAAWMICVWMYNDLEGHSAGPLERNFWNVVALGSLGWGSTEALLGAHKINVGSGVGYEVPRVWLLLTSAVIFTTVHAQDMEDMEGDKATGRRTSLLVYGEVWARWLLASFAILWSVVCPVFWKVSSVAVWSPTLCIGGAIAVLTTTRRDRASDKLVWNLWCIWIGILYILPIFSPVFGK